jgi:hypothetical protein
VYLGVPVISRDGKIRASNVETIWVAAVSLQLSIEHPDLGHHRSNDNKALSFIRPAVRPAVRPVVLTASRRLVYGNKSGYHFADAYAVYITI